MPRFRIKTILLLTVVVAIALLSLVRPSIAWLVILPPLASMGIVFAVIRAIAAPSERIFWTGLVVGVTAYGSCVLFVELISAILGGPQTVSASIAVWAWELIHGAPPNRTGGPGRFSSLEVVSFIVCLYFIVGVLLSVTATLLAQFLMRKQEQGAKP
jgi:hypothetical protein